MSVAPNAGCVDVSSSSAPASDCRHGRIIRPQLTTTILEGIAGRRPTRIYRRALDNIFTLSFPTGRGPAKASPTAPTRTDGPASIATSSSTATFAQQRLGYTKYLDRHLRGRTACTKHYRNRFVFFNGGY